MVNTELKVNDSVQDICWQLAESHHAQVAPINDAVNTPSHYMIIGNTEACDLIRVMLEQYKKDNPEATPYQCYCAGNVFKYRLRAGGKDNVEQEIAKANKYKEMCND